MVLLRYHRHHQEQHRHRQEHYRHHQEHHRHHRHHRHHPPAVSKPYHDLTVSEEEQKIITSSNKDL